MPSSLERLIGAERPGLAPEFRIHSLAHAHPAIADDPGAQHTVIIANQRTALPRLTDTPRNARKYRKRSVAALAAFRAMEDANFANRGKTLARRMDELNRFRRAPEFYPVTSGAEFIDALIIASQAKPIKNLVIYGHAAATALYMREDIGFYADVGEVARKSDVVSGFDQDREQLLRLMGARDLRDLARYVKEGHIRFARDAMIVFAGCGVAGGKSVELLGIGGQTARILEATAIASIDVTDQSMARSERARHNNEFSRGSWVRFFKDETPERLNTKVIDVLRYLVPDEPREPAPESIQVDSMPAKRLRCAAAAPDDPALCGGAVAPDAISRDSEMLALNLRTGASAFRPS